MSMPTDLAQLVLTLCAVGSLVVGCSNGASPRCEKMCKREAECAEELSKSESFKFDQDECVRACVVLERDTASKLRVDEHEKCAQAASTCEELFECR